MEIKMESYKTALLAILLLTFLSFTSSSASAQILLFDNGSAFLASGGYGSGGYGYYADAGNPPYSPANPTYSAAGDVFTPSVTGTANYVSFAGLYYGGLTPTTDSFVLSLYSTSSGSPNSLISTSMLPSFSRTLLGSGISQTIYQFSGLLQTPLSLTAGTSYYFGITDATNPYRNFAVAVSAAVPPGGSTAEYSLEAGTSSTFLATGPDALSFQLEAVPWPKGWVLVVLACICLVLAKRCARRSPRA
jgi:hypothetical protein